VVIGGDGFMLRTVKDLGLDRTYLGLNAGHLGFLLNDVDDWDKAVAQVVGDQWTAHVFPVLEAEILTVAGETVIEHAINDVYLERSTGQSANLALSIDGHQVVDRIAADGIIIATAIGSTAYTFSAGGPACHPSLNMVSVTPICPHRPRLSPFALPGSAQLQVDVLDHGHRPVRAVADGRSEQNVQSVKVRLAEQGVRLAYLEGHDFTYEMVTKILRP
jgi:NAD+ kinase